MEERNDFFKWYDRKVTENPEEPPAQVWENIADELDTNEVWERVAAHLDARSGGFPRKAVYYGIAVALLLFLAGGSYLYYQHKDTTQATRTATIEKAQGAQQPAAQRRPGEHDHRKGDTHQDKNRVDRTDHAGDEISANTGTEAHTAAEQPHATENKANAVADGHVADVVTMDDERVIEGEAAGDEMNDKTDTDAAITNAIDINGKISVKEINTDNESANEEAAPDAHVDYTPITDGSNAEPTQTFASSETATVFALSRMPVPDSMLRVRTDTPPIALTVARPTALPGKTFRKSIAIGVTASAKNTWLLNRNTFTGLEKKTLHTTRADFGKDVGVVVTYDFSPVFAVQLEGLFLSEMGQRYSEYLHGKYVKRDIDLHYYRGDVVLKYSPGKYFSGSPSNAHAVVGGLFYGTLKNNGEKINGIAAPATERYASNDYGAIVGYEYNRYLTHRLELTTGLRVNLGLRDVGTNSWTKTTTGSFNLNIALKYRFIFN